MHQDKFRTAPASKEYRENFKKIFGEKKKPAVKMTEEEERRRVLARKEYHAKLAEDGKKPADWYLANERRVPSNPDDYQKKPLVSEAYRANYGKVFKS